jgi:hypothetical protein
MARDAFSRSISELLTFSRRLGDEIGHRLYRVVLYEDGRGEMEFETFNPIECLVLRWQDEDELHHMLDQLDMLKRMPEGVMIRKKCVKCLMHERVLPGAEIL